MPTAPELSLRPHRGRKRDPIEQYINEPQIFKENGMTQLRYMVLTQGLRIPQGHDTCPYRLYVWQILMEAPRMTVDDYYQLIHQARLLKPEIYSKITNDTFRTLKTEDQFHEKVSVSLLTRILGVLAITMPDDVGYVQGLNVLLAPIAFACYKSEPQAYSIVHSLVVRHIPLYVTSDVKGVYTGCDLVEVVLRHIDPALAEDFDSKFFRAKIYAFPLVLTLSACTPPLSEVLRLWDYLFAYGIHMNILFIVAQLVKARDSLLGNDLPMKVLRTFPAIDYLEITKMALSFVSELPHQVYLMVARHGYDPAVEAEVKEYNRENAHLRPNRDN